MVIDKDFYFPVLQLLIQAAKINQPFSSKFENFL